MSDYITTFTKNKFSPVYPQVQNIFIEDIAHALSLMTRANGHFPEFYSVAQHCIACCKEALARNYTNRVALACLLHDASEAYLSDVTRPVKKNIEVYIDIENRLQDMIYTKFMGNKLNKDECELVHDIDNTMLYHEFVHYMDEEIQVYKGELRSHPNFKFIDFKEVEKDYKDLFYSISESL